MAFQNLNNQAILQELGERTARQRLNQNITQAELAKRAGVARIVIHRLENGLGCTLESLLRILRALGFLEQLSLFLPEPGLSPVQLAKLKGAKRQRATGKRCQKKKEF